jgi:hypothetical protein
LVPAKRKEPDYLDFIRFSGSVYFTQTRGLLGGFLLYKKKQYNFSLNKITIISIYAMF